MRSKFSFLTVLSCMSHSNYFTKWFEVRHHLRVGFQKLFSGMATLETLNFDNRVLKSLPVDSITDNKSRQVEGACFSLVKPSPLANPETVVYSTAAFELIDLPNKELERDEFKEYFSGNRLLPGSNPAAHCYCGHQFGNFAGQLGDGATMYLGEVVNQQGKRWEIQFKGAGKTPYSRSSDGRKVLRSSIREFLCSEAMHFLGIPTTRAASCVTSDSRVERDINYSGNSILERCTVILRIAPTFLRFGSFEIVRPSTNGRAGPSAGRKDITESLLKYSIESFFPEILQTHPENLKEQSLAFLEEVMKLTAVLVTEWQCVGFCHGVLNTDNMSILGLTIDYGPFGFLDAYDADNIPNASDNNGRYTYSKQPEICKWNLHKLAEAISLVLPMESSLPVVEKFDEIFNQYYLTKMRKKLGLVKEEEQDIELIESFLDTMQQAHSDFTNGFRSLSIMSIPGCPDFQESYEALMQELVAQSSSAEDLKKFYKPRMHPRELQMMKMMIQSNPQLLEIFGGNLGLQKEMMKMEKSNEIRDQTEDDKKKVDKEKWEVWLNKYKLRLEKEAEGLSKQEDIEELQEKRKALMNSNNPRFILRNYIAQNAIEAAENGDYSEVRRVLKLLETPFSDDHDLDDLQEKDQQTPVAACTDDDDTAKASSSLSSSSYYKRSLKSMNGIAYDSCPPNWAANLVVS